MAESGERVAQAVGDLARNTHLLLESCGDRLAEMHGWRDTRGPNAVLLHLVNKHHWPPPQVRGMTPEDLLFCAREDAPKDHGGPHVTGLP